MPHRSLSIETNTHDLHFDDAGALVVADDAECVSQMVRQHIELYSGEWFLDVSAGVPWFEFIYIEPFDQVTAESLLKEEILSVPGVISISEFEVKIDNVNRGFHISKVVVQTEYDVEVQI